MIIEKQIVSEESASPYQGYPQMGDIIFVISLRDNRRSMIIDWCNVNVVHSHRVFDWIGNKTAIWIADDREVRKFEEEWM